MLPNPASNYWAESRVVAGTEGSSRRDRTTSADQQGGGRSPGARATSSSSAAPRRPCRASPGRAGPHPIRPLCARSGSWSNLDYDRAANRRADVTVSAAVRATAESVTGIR
ncbi:hypothetical protein HBB16_08135 [Pseudonocardia sp. MCCB 268]|nr:hypothetical protein [Pseudonocardia cytotoxica]